MYFVLISGYIRIGYCIKYGLQTIVDRFWGHSVKDFPVLPAVRVELHLTCEHPAWCCVTICLNVIMVVVYIRYEVLHYLVVLYQGIVIGL